MKTDLSLLKGELAGCAAREVEDAGEAPQGEGLPPGPGPAAGQAPGGAAARGAWQLALELLEAFPGTTGDRFLARSRGLTSSKFHQRGFSATR